MADALFIEIGLTEKHVVQLAGFFADPDQIDR